MNTIHKHDLDRLGSDRNRAQQQLSNYYYLASIRSKSTKTYRHLTSDEIAVLLQNNNYSPDWSTIWVSELFDPHQIQDSKFYGTVRIGNIKPIYLEYRDLKLPCGIYHSHIINCDIGDDNAIHHVRYMANFLLANDVMLSNINEMETSENAKFGNAVLKHGEEEEKRFWMEVCNENAGRAILPFDGMKAADAFIWTIFKADKRLQQRLQEITDNKFSVQPGFYSEIGNQVVLKNSNMIKDVIIGDHAYIKGVNKLKNLTIHSSQNAYTQIGEGCEIVNGIIGYGCRIFYGVKAVRFILSSFSQLKYGARLINSFLGENSTISCCEVLNSLLFPAHEQHHNNSFLCAALIMGQSNMAAGATIGSNHNSRAADGEILANRGFWPGLCVSLKHPSRFASYTLIVKGDFPYELNIQIPFSLISNDTKNDQLVMVPGYWFLYNMYGLMRNSYKFKSRDKRIDQSQYLEYDALAPDTVNEIFEALQIIEKAVQQSLEIADINIVRAMLLDDHIPISKEIYVKNTENSKRKVVLHKAQECYILFHRLIRHYAASQLVEKVPSTFSDFFNEVGSYPKNRELFMNMGGQLVPKSNFYELIKEINTYSINSWSAIHQRYAEWSLSYKEEKFRHAMAALAEISNNPFQNWDNDFIMNLLRESLTTREWIMDEVFESRARDYTNPFRKLLYDTEEEMLAVLGDINDNEFIQTERKSADIYRQKISKLMDSLSLTE